MLEKVPANFAGVGKVLNYWLFCLAVDGVVVEWDSVSPKDLLVDLIEVTFLV